MLATPDSAPRFADYALDPSVLSALTDLGFETPTPVQAQALPILLAAETDAIALAQTGTGKTAAFGLPLVQLIPTEGDQPLGLVLAPTRELCVQIARDLLAFARHRPQLKIAAVYGGAPIHNQIRAIRDGVQLVVATPGRLIDLTERGAIRLDQVRYVVLDEADEMLNMGFRDALETILSQTPQDKRTWLFSATMPPEVRRMAAQFMHEPVEIKVGRTGEGASNLTHHYTVVPSRDKYAALKRLVDFYPDIFGVIFCRTRAETQEVAEMLGRDGYNAESLHGDLTQQQRDRVMDRFRARTLQLLVATDVAARGIDVDNVTHVLHFSLPDDPEVYTHRSGRTARAGRSGVSIALVGPREVGRIRQLEKVLKREFTRMPVPTGQEVTEKRLLHLIRQVKEVKVDSKQLDRLLAPIYEELKDLTREDLIQRFVSHQFNHILDYYRNQPDLNPSAEPREFRSDRDPRPARNDRDFGGNGGGDFADLYLNVGTKDGLDRDTLLRMLEAEAGLTAQQLGRIQVRDIKAYFEVPTDQAQHVMRALSGIDFGGRRTKADWADTGNRGGFRRPPRQHVDGRKPFGAPKRGGFDRDRGGFSRGPRDRW